MRTDAEFAFLISFIQSRTTLLRGKDFNVSRMKKRSKEIQNPRDYARIIPITKGFDQIKKKATFDLLFSELERIDLKPEACGQRIRVEIQNKPIPKIKEEPGEKQASTVEPLEVQVRRFEILKSALKTLPLLVVFNKDQNDLSKGIVYGNCFDEIARKNIILILTQTGMLVEERIGKDLNLTFVLSHDSIDLSNVKIEKREFNGKTIELFLWIFLRIYKIDIKVIPLEHFTGIAGRGIILCGEPEIFQIKKELEEKYGIIMILNSTWKTKSDFYVLTTPESKEIYAMFNRQINPCDLIQILRNPKIEDQIKEKYKHRTEKMEKGKTLSIKVAETLRADGFVLSQDRRGSEVCPQLRHHGADFVKISALGGTLEQKQALIKKIKKYLMKLKDVMITDNGGIETSMTVSIPGLKNTPRKKRKDAKAPPLTEKPEATPAQPAIESLSSPSSDEEKLRASLDDMNIKEEVKKQIRQYFLDKEAAEKIKKANDEVLEILNRLQKKL